MTKTAITIIASEETYQNLSSFETIDQLNETVREYKILYTDQLTKSAVKVLNYLQCYSAKYKGVSYRTKNNIAQDLGISRRTVIRACQQLEALGIIKQYEMKRKSDMQQTSNAIVIQSISAVNENKDESQNVTQDPAGMSHQKDNTSLKQIHNINKRNEERLDHSYTPHNVPSDFVKAVKPFFNNAKVIYDLWNRVMIVNKQTEIDFNTLTGIAVDSFKQAVFAKKIGHIKGDFNGYWYGTMRKMIHSFNARHVLNNSFNWLSV